MFSATVPARQTAVLHLDAGELLLTRYKYRPSLEQTDRQTDATQTDP